MLSLFDRGPFIAFEPSRGVICRCLNVEAAAEALKVFDGIGEIHVDQNFRRRHLCNQSGSRRAKGNFCTETGAPHRTGFGKGPSRAH